MIDNIGSSTSTSTYSSFSPFLLMGVFMVISLLIGVLIIVSNWKVYQKAGKPGWASIVPIYNIIVLLEIVGKPTWWILLFFIPIANIVVAIMIAHQLAKAFGQDVGFTLGLIFLPFIFYPLLAFGKYSYQGAIPPLPTTVPISSETPTSTTV